MLNRSIEKYYVMSFQRNVVPVPNPYGEEKTISINLYLRNRIRELTFCMGGDTLIWSKMRDNTIGTYSPLASILIPASWIRKIN